MANLPVPEQYVVLDTFSPNTTDNIKKVALSLLGDPQDLYQPLSFRNIVGYADLVINITEISILVSLGSCSIGGVLLEFLEGKTLLPNEADSYIFETDDIPASDSSGIVEEKLYVAVYYNPTTEEENVAYIGLVRNSDLFNDNRQYICFLGEIEVTFTNGLVTEIKKIDLQNRDFLLNEFDGGDV